MSHVQNLHNARKLGQAIGAIKHLLMLSLVKESPALEKYLKSTLEDLQDDTLPADLEARALDEKKALETTLTRDC